MNAANRPVDFLLNTDSVKVSQAQRRDIGREASRDSDVSSSKIRERSFDDVYRQQRREDAQVRQSEQSARRNDSQERAESRIEARQQQAQVARQSAADKRSQKDVQVSDNGKALPPTQRLSSADDKSRVVTEDAADGESVVTDSSKNIEVTDLNTDVDVTVSFDTPELASQQKGEQELSPLEVAEQETSLQTTDLIDTEEADFSLGEQSAQASDEQTVVSFDSSLLTGVEAKEDADTSESSQAEQESLVGQNAASEQPVDQELKTTADEALVLQAQQPAAEQQAKVAATDGTKEYKQSALADVIDSRVKGDVNVASTTKGAATGAEQSAQAQSQDRFTPGATGQEFKLLREQFSAANLKAATGNRGAMDASASTATDSAAESLPRLNALAQTAQALGPARPGTVTASVQAPVNSPDWGQAMSQRIMWLVNRGISAAELQLNPRDLGPVDVRINVNGEQTTVQFTSQQPAVREALESSVVRLREMMESSGLNLADVNVSDQSHSEQAQSDSRGSSNTTSADDNNDNDGGIETQTVQRIESDGLVDFYA